MDTLVIISVIFGIITLSDAAESMLRCIECEHIGWNQTYTFDGVQNIYLLLQGKYNPACAQNNPRDQSQYNQNWQNQQNQQQQQQQQQQLQPQQQPGNQFNPFYSKRYDIRETICPVYANTNRCNYISGRARVNFLSYNGEMTLQMDIRNCFDPTSQLQDGCYQRDTNLGYPEVRNFLQDRLQFLGSVRVLHFKGEQCYCSTDMCSIVSAARNVVASSLSLALSLIAFIVIK